MKKIVISSFVIVAFAIYSLHARDEQNSATVSIATTSLRTNTSTGSTNTASNTSAASTPPPSNSSTTSTTAMYKDGSYTGDAADAYYGYIQVKVTVSGGKITDVAFLQHPNDQRESQQINSQAMPLLKQEAIQAQSVQIDGVSGATDSSQAFIQSLSSALNQAKA